MHLTENSYSCFPTASVTVITVVRNSESFITQAIDSVINQTYTDWHYFIIDDASTDRTYEIAKAYAAGDTRITVLKKPKKNVNTHLNEALRSLKSAFFAFLDGDDVWEPTKLATQVYSVDHFAILGSMVYIKEFGQSTNGQFLARDSPALGVGRTAFLCKRQIFDEVGYFDELFNFADFLEWYSRVKRLGIQIATVEETLAHRRIHDTNMTMQIKGEDYLKMLRNHMLLKKNK